MTKADSFEIAESPLGRIVIPSDRPESVALFWTTVDFDGRLDEQTVATIIETARISGASPDRLETCTQVHGTRSIHVEKGNHAWSECSDCDALWTREAGVGLGIKIADCLPVSVLDEWDDEVVIINLHAGWRGAAAGIVPRTLDHARSGNTPERARAWLGPSIRSCCFEVGEEVVDAFVEGHPYAEEYVDRSRAKPHLDLAGIVTRSLIDLGFEEEMIWDGGLCTRCPDSIFHSYRRSGPRAGRNLAVIAR